MAKIIDGKKIAETISQEIVSELQQLKSKGCQPRLTVILVGNDPASQTYVGNKQKKAELLGIGSETILLPQETSEKALLQLVDDLNANPNVHGILVQLPLPKHISSNKVIMAIHPDKDVDGFHPINRGRLVSGEDCLLPCTPAGIQQMLLRSGYDPSGKHVVVVGRSGIVGMPLAMMMMQKKPGANATVTLCHTGTLDLGYHTRQADILVVASGRPNTITKDMVKPGVVVIDVGTNRLDDATVAKGYRWVGDVDFAGVQEIAEAISPVPGGVGPLTIIMLMQNTVKAARAQFEAASANR